MRIAEKLSRKVNDNFTPLLRAAFKAKFGLELETHYSIFAMAYISVRADDEALTQEQADWMAAYEEGYVSVMNQIHN